MNELKKANKEIGHANLVIDEYRGRFFVHLQSERKTSEPIWKGHATIAAALLEAWDVM